MPQQTLLGQARWIWLKPQTPKPNHFVCFRKTFTLKGIVRRAVLDISVESDFILSINGTEAVRGQYPDWPQRKTYTRVNVGRLLRKGKNVISVLAHFRGLGVHEHPLGRPGLIAALRMGTDVIVSDATWRVREHPAFRSGPMPRVTSQMRVFSTRYDARREIPWQKVGYVDTGWPLAKIVSGATDGYWQELLPRPVPPLSIGEETPARLVAQGHFVRTVEEGSFADIMSRDALIHIPAKELCTSSAPLPDRFHLGDGRWLKLQEPRRGVTGCFVILDLGREEFGLLTLDLNAPAGTVVDIAHGEHLDDGCVRMSIAERNFADRYICRAGRNRFTLPFRRLGLRYLQIHLWRLTGPVRLNTIGVKPMALKVEAAGGFQTHDALANRTHQVAVRTLRLCMHDHYEDCPWREQGLYAFDARNQALFGYYVFGNYDFAQASFDLLAQGLTDEGQLALHVMGAAEFRRAIPIFSLVWITALAEHWLYSGRSDLFDRYGGHVECILQKACERYDADTGLYHLPRGPKMWHFYEWTAGLQGDPAVGDPAVRHDAPYNIFLLETMRNYAWMLQQSGRTSEVGAVVKRFRRLARAIVRAFWDERRQAFATYRVSGKTSFYSDFVQILAMQEGLVPARRGRAVLGNLQDRGFAGMTFSSMVYLVRALMGRDASSRRFVSATVARHWEPMTLAGATSFWETALGGDDFDKAGSLCHAWSSLPVYYYQAWVLGVHPLAPDFKRFVIRPYPDRFFTASGAIVTPHGPIEVAWTRQGDTLSIAANGPADLRPVIESLPEAPIARAMYNGKRVRVSKNVHYRPMALS